MLLQESEVRKIIKEEVERAVLFEAVIINEGFWDSMRAVAKVAADRLMSGLEDTSSGIAKGAEGVGKKVSKAASAAVGKVTAAAREKISNFKSDIATEIFFTVNKELQEIAEKAMKRVKEACKKYLKYDDSKATVVAVEVVTSAVQLVLQKMMKQIGTSKDVESTVS